MHNNNVNRFQPALHVPVVAMLFLAGCTDHGTTVDRVSEEDGAMYSFAGQPRDPGNDGDGGAVGNSNMYWPMDVTPLASGEILIVDNNNHRIRRVDADGIINNFIGSGFLGDDRKGAAAALDLNHPVEVKVAPNGNYWIATFHNWSIKEIDDTTMTVVQVIGDTARGYRGDFPENAGNIHATVRPRFDLPSSIVFDNAGLMYVMDQGNTRVRRIDLNAKIISLFAGGTRGDQDGLGSGAQFAFPGAETVGDGTRGGGMDISPNGEDIYIADTENNKIRKLNIATQTVTTIAGTGDSGWEGDGGPALSAQLNYPADLSCAGNGDVYVADTHNHVIRKIDGATGIITTVAGNGLVGFSPDGMEAREAKLNQPFGVAFDNATNTLYIADTFNHQVKKVKNPL